MVQGNRGRFLLQIEIRYSTRKLSDSERMGTLMGRAAEVRVT